MENCLLLQRKYQIGKSDAQADARACGFRKCWALAQLTLLVELVRMRDLLSTF